MSKQAQIFARRWQGVVESEQESAHEERIARLRAQLAEARATSYTAWVLLRAQISVFDLIEAEGEPMEKALCDRGNFATGEIRLVERK